MDNFKRSANVRFNYLFHKLLEGKNQNSTKLSITATGHFQIRVILKRDVNYNQSS